MDFISESNLHPLSTSNIFALHMIFQITMRNLFTIYLMVWQKTGTFPNSVMFVEIFS